MGESTQVNQTLWGRKKLDCKRRGTEERPGTAPSFSIPVSRMRKKGRHKVGVTGAGPLWLTQEGNPQPVLLNPHSGYIPPPLVDARQEGTGDRWHFLLA